MKSDAPIVYVGIVTYNSEKLIAACITSLISQRNVTVRITVLDNASTRSIARIIRRFKLRVVFIQSEVNLGFGGGHNAILRSLPLRDSDYYMALNPDALPEPDCIARLVRASQRHHASWVTGKLYKDTQEKIIYSVGHALRRDGYAFNIGYGIVDRGQFSAPREVFGAPGAAVLYRGAMTRALSARGNFFDPNLFMYYEDVDVDWRARLQGLRCWYEPTAIVKHPGGQFSRSLEAGVLANRFLSVCKNAFIGDLIFYHLPRIALHIAFRCIVTPKIGVQLFRKVVFVSPGILMNRMPVHVSKDRLHKWFAAAASEQSRQPTTYTDRLRVFVRRLLHA